MKKIFFILALAICPSVFGQEISADQLNSALNNATTELNALKQQLSLTPQQEEKIKLVLDGIHQKFAYVEVDQYLTPAQKQENIEQNTLVKRAYIMQYLNPDQVQVYKTSLGL